MLEIMRDNTELLGLAARRPIDSTLAWTRQLLRQETVGLQALQAEWVDGLGTLTLEVENKAAQILFRLPGPSRLDEVVAKQGRHLVAQRPVVRGRFLHGVDEGVGHVRAHFDVISQEHDVQVYELVAVDVTGAPPMCWSGCRFCERQPLLPLGFSLDHPVYDTTRVEAQALSDVDFTRMQVQARTV